MRSHHFAKKKGGGEKESEIERDSERKSTYSLQITNKDLYPDTYKALLLLITMPVSTASVERSFSVMRRLKTYIPKGNYDNRTTFRPWPTACAQRHEH